MIAVAIGAILKAAAGQSGTGPSYSKEYGNYVRLHDYYRGCCLMTGSLMTDKGEPLRSPGDEASY
jgi:hypothetical protein